MGRKIFDCRSQCEREKKLLQEPSDELLERTSQQLGVGAKRRHVGGRLRGRYSSCSRTSVPQKNLEKNLENH